MRSPAAPVDIAGLSESRDCLVNVDAAGSPVPSARFMGGREIELLGGGARIDDPQRQPALLGALAAVLERGSMILPSFVPGSGPFPRGAGRWVLPPEDPVERLAAVCLYAALLADVSLDLIGTRERLLIEGRFARCELLTRSLAALRPQTTVYVASSESEVAFGALRLRHRELAPASRLTPVQPLRQRLEEYRLRWREAAAGQSSSQSLLEVHDPHLGAGV
jgi:sugar (pentulose or hexulose) kinase